ncbi:acyl-CoA dehydrogenase [Novipirellula rosea]|uniref:Medium-chain specific acyl-CoA dehydrogenase, mitochondrial n=1 Tax=Novipirellula rosea TaxID=1031540 RepID=A0ABP8MCZ6_9BACT
MKAFQFVCLFGLFINWSGLVHPQEVEILPKRQQIFLTPNTALDRVQQEHSTEAPIVVSQDELDQLIDCKGGGACPISAALIASQGLRAMAGLPVDPQPHRTALRVFRDKPELLLGRISNDRFVNLIAYLCADFQEMSTAISVLSAPNSPHSALEPKWSETDGPDLSVKHGEMKVLAYTVTTADGTVRGRHFVLLKENNEGKLSILNPGSPLKQRFFLVEYRGVPTAAKQRVFFVVPDGLDKSKQTYELNTIFTVRFLTDDADGSTDDASRVETIKGKIDLLADRLRSSGELTSPVAWRSGGAAFGLPGIDLPVEVGGGGYSASEAIELFRHAGRINLNLRDVIGGAHGRPLTKSSTALSQDVLRKLVAGEAYVAVAITEPTAGTDMKAMKSKAVRYEAGFKLTGRKLWNARLRQATHVVLYTLAADSKDGERSAFLIPLDHPGLKVVDRYAHGLTGNSFGGLEFDDMFVSRDHLLGEDGDGGEIFNEHFQYWRLMQAAAAIGCGEAALDQMAERIKTREAFGAPIGRFTHLQQPIGEYLTKLRMAMSLAREAAQMIDNGDYEGATPLVNGLKAEGVEIALSACDAAMRAHGAMGYSRETDLGDRVRDLMGLRIADGTTDVMRMSVVSEKYGSDLWKMAIYGVRDTDTNIPKDKLQPASAE